VGWLVCFYHFLARSIKARKPRRLSRAGLSGAEISMCVGTSGVD
jgi:hypothetical protein